MHARSADFQRPTSTPGNGSLSTFEEPSWYRTRCSADPAFGLHSAVTCALQRCESKAAAPATTDRAGIGADDNGPTFRHWSCATPQSCVIGVFCTVSEEHNKQRSNRPK